MTAALLFKLLKYKPSPNLDPGTIRPSMIQDMGDYSPTDMPLTHIKPSDTPPSPLDQYYIPIKEELGLRPIEQDIDRILRRLGLK